MKMEFNHEQADESFDELPESGDSIDYNGEEHIIKNVNVVNGKKIVLVTFRKRDVKRYDQYDDYSVNWKTLPERFLE